MSIAYLLTGGNLGNRFENLEKAAGLIQLKCGDIRRVSAVYETAAWGITDQPAFYNQALAVQTALTPEVLMKTILGIEEKMGRIRSVKLGPRIIDIDILLMDQLILDSDFLRVPHPFMGERRFVLTPLAEIAGGIIHPVFKKSISEMLKDCSDLLDVHKISGDN